MQRIVLKIQRYILMEGYPVHFAQPFGCTVVAKTFNGLEKNRHFFRVHPDARLLHSFVLPKILSGKAVKISFGFTP